VFDRVAAAAEEVAGAAVEAARRTDILRDLEQIHPFGRHAGPGRLLLVGAGGVVTDQAVDVGRVAEVESGIGPTVAGMTAGAARLVAGNRDAEVVDGVLLAAIDALAVDRLLGRPGPVAGLHEVPGRLFVTGQALRRDLRGGLDRPLHVGGMVVGCPHPGGRNCCQGGGQREHQPHPHPVFHHETPVGRRWHHRFCLYAETWMSRAGGGDHVAPRGLARNACSWRHSGPMPRRPRAASSRPCRPGRPRSSAVCQPANRYRCTCSRSRWRRA